MSTDGKNKTWEFFLDFLSGGVSGAIAKTCSAPAERVKLLLQTQDTNPKIKTEYTGVFNCFARVYREEGLASFWQGNFVNVIRYFPTQALNFALKDTYKNWFNPYDPKKEKTKFFIGNIISGGMAGSTTSLFTYPLDFVRTRLAVDLGKASQREYTGILDCMKKIIAKEGVLGLYRGLGMAFFGLFMYRGLYFGFYDSMKHVIFDENKDLGVIFNIIYAQSCVMAAELVSYPTDTVKRKLMLQAGKAVKEYSGIWDCVVKSYHSRGLLGFWQGYLSNIFRSLGSSICLVMYDELKKQRKVL
jgi:solute carrier family 25 (mitochondrial adenine nucleotide translocator), member 4/5/6/31